MNEKASSISEQYQNKFRAGFNQYVQIKESYPYDSFEKMQQMLWRLGMLVEIWARIESQERSNGRIREDETGETNR